MDELLDLMEEILESGDNPLGYFPFICKIDSIEEVDDQEAWHKANPSMEYMPILTTPDSSGLSGNAEVAEQTSGVYHKEMNWPDRNDEETVASWRIF